MKKSKLMFQFFGVMLFLINGNANAQNGTAFHRPTIWLRADKAGSNINVWQDVSGHNYDGIVMNNQTMPDTCLFNYQKCFLFDSTSKALKINYQGKPDAGMLVFAVFKPSNSFIEKGIWTLGLDSNVQVKLTTERLRNVYQFIKYNDSTKIKPTINLLSQGWNDQHIDSTMSNLIVAGSDSINFTGKFAEFILYDTALAINDIFKVHTYLGIKYGVSIQEMDYINSSEQTLWNYQDNILYKNDIAGIGKDSLLQINQKQGAGNGGESPLKIAAGKLEIKNDSNKVQLAEEDFLIWGNNGFGLDDLAMDTIQTDTTQTDSTQTIKTTKMSRCVWQMKSSGGTYQNIGTQIVLNTKKIANLLGVKLVINRFGDIDFPAGTSIVTPPDSIDSTGNYYFNNIHWDVDHSGSDVFGFQIVRADLANRSHTNSQNDTSGNGNNSGKLWENNLAQVVNDSVEFGGNGELNSTLAKQTEGQGEYYSPQPENKGNTIPGEQDNNGINIMQNAIFDCSMFPNPTTRNYAIDVKMNTKTPITVTITDENSKKINEFKRSGLSEYFLYGFLNETGCYLVTIKTEKETKNYKLIVQ